MDLVNLGAISTFWAGLKFTEIRRLVGKTRSRAVFLDLKMCGALPNSPVVLAVGLVNFSPAASILRSKRYSVT